jgi:hypothetical protein
MDEAAQNPPVIGARRTAAMRQRLDPGPLLIVRPKQLAHGEPAHGPIAFSGDVDSGFASGKRDETKD